MDINDTVAGLGRMLTARSWMLGGAESCTGGLVSHMLTSVSGSSAWFKGAVVAYANEIKMRVLGVPEAVLAGPGAVSQQCVYAMAEGVRKALGVEVGFAVSGIAGPTGGTPDKPVGTVWMAWALPGGVSARRFNFSGDRAGIKTQSAGTCITELAGLIEQGGG